MPLRIASQQCFLKSPFFSLVHYAPNTATHRPFPQPRPTLPPSPWAAACTALFLLLSVLPPYLPLSFLTTSTLLSVNAQSMPPRPTPPTSGKSTLYSCIQCHTRLAFLSPFRRIEQTRKEATRHKAK